MFGHQRRRPAVALVALAAVIDDGDDDLAIDSSASDGPAHDISLSNCAILHGHGLSIGSYTGGGVYNVSVHDDTLSGTAAGIRLKTARGRGGDVHAITKVTATGATTAGQIIGAPELPITALSLTSVSIAAKTGVVVRNATVTTSSVTITPSSGSAWILQSNAHVS